MDCNGVFWIKMEYFGTKWMMYFGGKWTLEQNEFFGVFILELEQNGVLWNF